MSPVIRIIVGMKTLGLSDEKLLELILLGAYQAWRWLRGRKQLIPSRPTSICRRSIWFHYRWTKTAARSTWDQCQGHVRLPQPLLRETRGNQVYIMLLLMLVNNCPNEHFWHVFLRDAVLQISAAISEFKGKAELGEFWLMLILRMCALSSVVLLPRTKLLNLLYPIPGKGLANHLLEVNVKEPEHQDALKCVSHHFGLK